MTRRHNTHWLSGSEIALNLRRFLQQKFGGEGRRIEVKRLDAFTTSKVLPSSPSDLHALFNLPNDLEECRKDLVDACQSLKQLGNGPNSQ